MAAASQQLDTAFELGSQRTTPALLVAEMIA